MTKESHSQVVQGPGSYQELFKAQEVSSNKWERLAPSLERSCDETKGRQSGREILWAWEKE